MKPNIAIVLIAAIYVLGFFSHAFFLKKTVYGDGIFYYSWLRSIVVDHDLNFANEYKYSHATQPVTLSGTYGNKYSIGPALLWAPLYMTVHTILRGDGWSFPYQLSVGITSVFAALTGLVLLVRILQKKSQGIIGLTLLLVAGATNLLFYGSLDPVNSHALSFFAVTLLLALLASPSIEWVAVGVAVGLLASIRLQDVVFGLLLFPYRKKIQIIPLLYGLLLSLLPQLAAWYGVYGSLANPYLAGGEGFTFLHPHILPVLFSVRSGILLWTPVVAFGIAGLCINFRKNLAYIAVFVLELLFVSSWSTWWQGASVSGRMFVSSLPLVAIGLASIILPIYPNRLWRAMLPALVLAFGVANAMGIAYYLMTN